MSENYMLSTKDNPYNPHTQFDEWRVWDETEGYNSLSLLARVVRTSDELPDALQDLAIDYGIEEIVEHNVSGMHIRVPAPKV